MRIALLSLSCLALASPAALAQDAGFDPAAAVEGFLTDKAILGADTATVGKVTGDGDRVTAENVAMHWSVTVSAMDQSVTFDLDADIPSLTVQGLAREGDGHSVGALEIPAATVRLEIEGAPEPMSYQFDITNYSMVDGKWGPFPTIKADPQAPVSRFAPLVDWAFSQSYQRSGADRISGVFTAGADRQEIAYGPAYFGPVVEGRLESFEYGPFTVRQAGEMPKPDGTTEPVEIVFDYGAITGRGINLNPLGQLLTGNGPATGSTPILEHLKLDGMEVKAEDQVDLSVGSVETENLAIDPTRGPLLEKLDPVVIGALAGTPPPPDQLISLVLDIYGSYGVGRYAISDIDVKGPDMAASLARMVLEGLDSAGMKRFAVEGASAEGPQGKGALEAIEVRDVSFPPRDAFIKLIVDSMNDMPLDPSSLAGIPTVGGFAIKGLSADTGVPGAAPLELGLFNVDLSNFVASIPTRIAVALEGLQMPLALVQLPQAQMILSAVGADPVTADASLELGYDEANKSVTLDHQMTVGKVGALSAEASLTGIPPVVFQNPMRANEAIVTAAIGGVRVEFRDEGITPFFVGMMSETAGVTAQEFAQGMAQQVEMQVAAMTGDGSLAGQLAETVRTYLADPQNLLITAAPAAPVPIAQLIGAAMAAPQQIPQLLNLTVTANQ